MDGINGAAKYAVAFRLYCAVWVSSWDLVLGMLVVALWFRVAVDCFGGVCGGSCGVLGGVARLGRQVWLTPCCFNFGDSHYNGSWVY